MMRRRPEPAADAKTNEQVVRDYVAQCVDARIEITNTGSGDRWFSLHIGDDDIGKVAGPWQGGRYVGASMWSFTGPRVPQPANQRWGPFSMRRGKLADLLRDAAPFMRLANDEETNKLAIEIALGKLGSGNKRDYVSDPRIETWIGAMSGDPECRVKAAAFIAEYREAMLAAAARQAMHEMWWHDHQRRFQKP